VRQAEDLMQSRAGREAGAPRAPRAKDADTIDLERRLADSLGLGVSVNHGDNGGKLEIRYKTLEQLDDLCRRLGVST